MSTTLRIREADKERLKRLQEAWHHARGDRPSQQALIGKMLEYVEAHRDAFLAEAAWQPLGPESLRRLRGLQGRYGGTATADVDAVVYGEER